MENRFEVKLELRGCGFTIEKGFGPTIQEARSDLVRRIEKNDLIFPPRKGTADQANPKPALERGETSPQNTYAG